MKMNLKCLCVVTIFLLSNNTYSQDIYTVTAYSHGCAMLNGTKPDKVHKPASNGEWPVYNMTAAADWKVLPEGTEVIIENIGVWKITDRSGSIINGKYVNNGRIKGKRIDLFVGSERRTVGQNCAFANSFGIRKLKVWKVPKLSTQWSTYNVIKNK